MGRVNSLAVRRWVIGTFAVFGVTAGLFLINIVGSASKGQAASASARDCGLAEGEGADVVATRVPRFLRIDGSEVVDMERSRGFMSLALNVPLSVRSALDLIKDRLVGTSFEVIHEDYEGFEAELFISGDGRAGMVRLRSSSCGDLSRLLFQVRAR